MCEFCYRKLWQIGLCETCESMAEDPSFRRDGPVLGCPAISSIQGAQLIKDKKIIIDIER